MRVLWSVLAAFLVLGAGCLDNASEENDDPIDTGGDGEPVGPGSPDQFNGTGTVPLAAGPVAQGGGGGEFSVGDNATLIFAEWRWDNAQQDLNGALRSPEAGTTGTVQNYDHTVSGGAPGSPDSPHNLTLTGEDVIPGTWGITAFGNGAAVQVPYQWAVTVFYGETSVPAGHTGLGNATA